jgi:hypothetical protein
VTEDVLALPQKVRLLIISSNIVDQVSRVGVLLDYTLINLKHSYLQRKVIYQVDTKTLDNFASIIYRVTICPQHLPSFLLQKVTKPL